MEEKVAHSAGRAKDLVMATIMPEAALVQLEEHALAKYPREGSP